MKCSQCVYWEKWSPFENRGYCHRYPPTKPTWPIVQDCSWCGEYSSVTKADAEKGE